MEDAILFREQVYRQYHGIKWLDAFSCNSEQVNRVLILKRKEGRYLMIKKRLRSKKGFPGGSDGRESACNAGDPGSIPGSGRSPEEGNGYPPKYSGLENSMDRGAWQATVHWVTKTQTQLTD